MGNKSRSFNGAKRKPLQHLRVADELDRQSDQTDEEEEQWVKYVPDINSIHVPMLNPHTKTFFKMSIYSPSHKLYTVNEEENSMMSDAGHMYTETSSVLGRRLRQSSSARIATNGSLNKKAQKVQSSDDIVMEEESFTSSGRMSIPSSGNISEVKELKNKYNSNSGVNTKANSGVQSLSSSIVMKKPSMQQHKDL